jgi:hypothetical protein
MSTLAASTYLFHLTETSCQVLLLMNLEIKEHIAMGQDFLVKSSKIGKYDQSSSMEQVLTNEAYN